MTATVASPGLTVFVVMFAGQMMPGVCVSFTVTVNERLDELFTASLTVHVTEVAPLGKVEPDGGLQTGTPTPTQLSVTVGNPYVTTAEQSPGAAGTLMLEGQVMTGGSVSLTVTVNEHEDVLFDTSLAVQVTVVVPFWKTDPDGGVHAVVTVEQASEA